MAGYFLSFNGTDRTLVERLAVGLRSQAIDVWVDSLEGGIEAGQPWIEKIEAALAQCSAFLLLIPEQGIDRWVRAELDFALKRQIDDPNLRIIPLLRPCVNPASLPPLLQRYHAISIATEPDPEALADQLKALPQHDEPVPYPENFCPYPGLQRYTEDQAGLFFGRRQEIREIGDQVSGAFARGQHWLQLEGNSGTGKSSLALAGLVPAMRRGLIDRNLPEWRVASFRPGRQPLRELASALYHAFDQPAGGSAAILQALKQPQGLSLWLRDHRPAEQGCVLVLDQFEELFTRPEAATANDVEMQALDALLADVLEDVAQPVLLITTIRTDFLHRLEELPRLALLLNSHAVRQSVTRVNREGLREAIERPALAVGLRLADGLTERLLRDTESTTNPMPLLAMTLQELWEHRTAGRLTNHAYQEQVGGIAGALNRRADTVLANFSPDQLEATRQLFISLVRTGRGSPDSKRVITRDEANQAIGSLTDPEELLRKLSGGHAEGAHHRSVPPARLLQPLHGERQENDSTDAAGDQSVELIHDALITGWDRLRLWVQQHRTELERRDDLEAAAAAWQAAGAPDDDLPVGGQLNHFRVSVPISPLANRYMVTAEALALRRQRRRRMVIGGAVTMAVVMSIAAALAWHQRNLAQNRLIAARDAANVINFEASQKLRFVPGADDVRRRLLAASKDLFERLGMDHDDYATRRAAAVTADELGDLAFSNGDMATAELHLSEAASINHALLEAGYGGDQAYRDLTLTYHKLGRISSALGRPAKALEHFNAAMRIRQQLVKYEPDNLELRLDLTASYELIGKLLLRLGRPEEARPYLEDNLEMRQQLVDSQPTNDDWLRALAIAQSHIAELYVVTGDNQRALTQYKIALHSARSRLSPEPSWSHHDLASLLIDYAETAYNTGDIETAILLATKAVQLGQGLVAAEASNALWQRILALGSRVLGSAILATGDTDEPARLFMESLAISQRQSDLDESNTQWQFELIASHLKLCHVMAIVDEFDEARRHCTAARDNGINLVQQDPTSPKWQRQLASSHSKLADVEFSVNNLAVARDHLNDSIGVYERLLSSAPEDPTNRDTLSQALASLASLTARIGDMNETTAVLARAITQDIWLLENNPGSARYTYRLVVNYLLLGDIATANSSPAAARRHYELALPPLEQLTSSAPKDVNGWRLLGKTFEKLRDVSAEAGDSAAARKYSEGYDWVAQRLVNN